MREETIGMNQIKENYEYYKELQEARGNFNYVYNKKEYPRGFTSQDKKVVDKRYAPSNQGIYQKTVFVNFVNSNFSSYFQSNIEKE